MFDGFDVADLLMNVTQVDAEKTCSRLTFEHRYGTLVPVQIPGTVQALHSHVLYVVIIPF